MCNINLLSAAVRDKEAQGGIFGHWGIGLIYIYAITLEETTDHNPGFVAQGLPIFTSFEFEHPFDREALGVGWERTRFKHTEVLKGLHLISHSCLPKKGLGSC